VGCNGWPSFHLNITLKPHKLVCLKYDFCLNIMAIKCRDHQMAHNDVHGS